MDYEKKYKDALANARQEYTTTKNVERKQWLEELFPELKESEDELTWLTQFIQEEVYNLSIDIRDNEDRIKLKNLQKSLAWLEKQGKIEQASYEIAEKEKYDFVSGQFIECRKSFDEFKEDNSYWFEYVGNDTYIGRSDNILNKSFHITPKQLYCLFTQQHCPKENNVVSEETNAPTAYGKYVDECLNEASEHFFSEGEDKYSVADLFYAGVRCGKSWLKKQCYTKKDVDDAYLKGISDAKNELEKQSEQKTAVTDFNAKDWYVSKVDGKIYDMTYNPADKVESKFKVGDWITNSIETVQINGYDIDYGYQVDYKGNLQHRDTDIIEKEYYHWTIQNAKDGDVLTNGEIILIFKQFEEPAYRQHIIAYIGLDITSNIQVTDDYWELGVDKASPATKEQCDLLFQKIEEAGYGWDAEKKELKKLTQSVTKKSDQDAWSDEDEENLQHCCMAISVDSLHTYEDKQEMEAWLKSLKNRIGG